MRDRKKRRLTHKKRLLAVHAKRKSIKKIGHRRLRVRRLRKRLKRKAVHHLTHHARKTGRKLDVVVDGLEGDERFDVTVEPYREEMMKELGLEETIGKEMKATRDLKKEIEANIVVIEKELEDFYKMFPETSDAGDKTVMTESEKTAEKNEYIRDQMMNLEAHNLELQYAKDEEQRLKGIVVDIKHAEDVLEKVKMEISGSATGGRRLNSKSLEETVEQCNLSLDNMYKQTTLIKDEYVCDYVLGVGEIDSRGNVVSTPRESFGSHEKPELFDKQLECCVAEENLHVLEDIVTRAEAEIESYKTEPKSCEYLESPKKPNEDGGKEYTYYTDTILPRETTARKRYLEQEEEEKRYGDTDKRQTEMPAQVELDTIEGLTERPKTDSTLMDNIHEPTYEEKKKIFGRSKS